MYCSNCGEKLFEGQTVCVKCGKAVEQEKKITEKEEIVPKEKVKATGNMAGHSKIGMALLCLFLGSFGAHNFIMGENRKGIVKIVGSLFCGVSLILAIIDFVKIVSGTYVCDPQAFF